MKFVINKGEGPEKRPSAAAPKPNASVVKSIDTNVRTVSRTLRMAKMEVQITRTTNNGIDAYTAVVADNEDRGFHYSGRMYLNEDQFSALVNCIEAANEQLAEWKAEVAN